MTFAWGPLYWNYIHTLSYTYPKKPNKLEIDMYYRAVYSYSDIIPCIRCRTHFKHILDNDELLRALQSRNTFVKYIWALHNNVNIKLRKHTVPFTVADAAYRRVLRNSKESNIFYIRDQLQSRTRIIIGLIVVICILLIYMWRRHF